MQGPGLIPVGVSDVLEVGYWRRYWRTRAGKEEASELIEIKEDDAGVRGMYPRGNNRIEGGKVSAGLQMVTWMRM